MDKMDELRDQLLEDVSRTIIANARNMVGYLQRDDLSPLEKDLGKDMLMALADYDITSTQARHLEKAMIQAQEHVIAWFFAVLDGNIEKPDWPQGMQLVDKSNKPIWNEEIQWKFTEVFLRVRDDEKI